MTNLRTLDIGDRCRLTERDGIWIITALKGRLNDGLRRGRLGVAPLHPILVNVDDGTALVVAKDEKVEAI